MTGFCNEFLVLLMIFVQSQHWVSFHKAETSFEGDRVCVALVLKVETGFHIQSVSPSDPALIPTMLKVELPTFWNIIDIKFPEAKELRLKGSNQALAVYKGELPIEILIDTKGRQPLNNVLKAIITYQACDDSKCYYPRKLEFDIPL